MQYYPEGCYNEKHEWMPTHGQRCKCKLVWIEESCAYCQAVCSHVAPKAPKEVKDVKAELFAAFDQMAAKHRRSASADIHSTGTTTQAAPPSSTQDCTPTPTTVSAKGARAPRRTKAEMAAARAKKAKELADIAALVTPAWLTESDPMLDALLAGEDVE